MRRRLDKLEKETLVDYLIRGYQLSLEFEAYREFLEFKKSQEPRNRRSDSWFDLASQRAGGMLRLLSLQSEGGMVVSGSGRT